MWIVYFSLAWELSPFRKPFYFIFSLLYYYFIILRRYSLNLSRSTHWDVHLAASPQHQWFVAFEEEARAERSSSTATATLLVSDSDSDNERVSVDEEDDGDEIDETADSMQESGIKDAEATNKPEAVMAGEKLADYFGRTRDYWVHIALEEGCSEAVPKELRQRSFAAAQAFFGM